VAIPRIENEERLFDVMYTCRAMRRLKPDPVPEDVLRQLVAAALQGPSGSNAQNWHFVIVRERAQKERLAALWRKTWDFYLETFARAAARPGEDLASGERMIAAGTYMVEHMAETPAIIFVATKRDEQLVKVLSSPATLAALVRHFGIASAARMLLGSPRINGLADGSTAYPAVQNLLLAARALGLGAVLTTPQFFMPGKFERVLGLPASVSLAAAIPVGYPVGKFGPVTRPDPERVISWDRWTA
jgi:nitroreductase